MKLWVNIFILSILFTSCDPSKRIARIIKRHPELVKTDTVWKVDTIRTKSVQKDTTFFYNQPDTVYMNQGKLQVKYYYNQRDSTIFIQGKCKADTIVKMYPIQVNSVSVAKALKWHEKLKIWIFDNAWWLIILIFILWKIFGKAIKVYFPFLKFL
jgi:hypothetical protein